MRLFSPVLLALCLLTPPSAPSPAPSPQQPTPKPAPAQAKGVERWLCKFLGIDPKIYEKMSRVRGGQGLSPGSRLAKLDLASRREEILWDCHQCWSPTKLDDGGVAVLRTDGLWFPPRAETPARHVIAADNLYEILGPIADARGDLLLLRRNDVQTEACSYSFWKGDVLAGQLQPLSEIPCLLEAELPLVLKPGRLQGDRLLVTSEGAPPLRPLISSLDERTGRKRPLAPWLDKQSPRVDRSDAIWWSDTEVLYVASAPRRLGQPPQESER